MSELPEPVAKMIEVLEGLPSVTSVGVYPKDLEEVDVSFLSLPGEFGDLPQVAIRRTDGGRPGERMVVCDISLERNETALLTVEFLAWWVRDWARSGHAIQLRATALPPRTDHIQLGRTLRFLIEHFHISESDDWSDSLNTIAEMAESIESNYADYQECFDEPADPAEAPEGYTLEELETIAESDSRAAYQLHLIYFEGEAVEPDQDKALQWLEKSVVLGSAQGQFRLALAYRSGEEFVEGDPVKAFGLFQEAAGQGHELATASVGECYMGGVGVTADPQEGFRWYQRAAESEHPVCVAELGDCYEFGKGVDIDLNKALELYQQSFDDGFDLVEPAIERVQGKLQS